MLQNCVGVRDSYLSAQIKISFLVELIRDWNVYPSAKLGCWNWDTFWRNACKLSGAEIFSADVIQTSVGWKIIQGNNHLKLLLKEVE